MATDAGTRKVGPKGQVVLPKALREQLDIQPGDEVSVWREGDHLVVRRSVQAAPLKGRCAGRSLTARLAEQRAADRAHEDAR